MFFKFFIQFWWYGQTQNAKWINLFLTPPLSLYQCYKLYIRNIEIHIESHIDSWKSIQECS